MVTGNAVMNTEYDLIEERVIALHSSGLTAHEIDERMNLECGTAHDVMVARWRFDKLRMQRGI